MWQSSEGNLSSGFSLSTFVWTQSVLSGYQTCVASIFTHRAILLPFFLPVKDLMASLLPTTSPCHKLLHPSAGCNHPTLSVWEPGTFPHLPCLPLCHPMQMESSRRSFVDLPAPPTAPVTPPLLLQLCLPVLPSSTFLCYLFLGRCSRGLLLSLEDPYLLLVTSSADFQAPHSPCIASQPSPCMGAKIL